jgi:hypothetical protein
MIWATKQYFKDLEAKLFPTLGNALRTKKIKKLIKLASFTTNNPITPISISYKCSRINMKVTPTSLFASISNK